MVGLTVTWQLTMQLRMCISTASGLVRWGVSKLHCFFSDCGSIGIWRGVNKGLGFGEEVQQEGGTGSRQAAIAGKGREG